MLKARGKLISLLTACMALVLMLVMGIATLSIQPKVASAADTTIEFALGANGSASHNDGSEKSSYSETVDGYTLNLTSGSKMYTGARDAKGNSCIKLGTSSAAGKFTLAVPNDVTSVVFAVGKYKTNTSKVTIAGTTYTLSKSSNDGAYDEITIDTTSTKSISVTTVSGGYRAMVNTITFVIPAPESACQHTETTTTTTAATCTEEGSTVVTCKACGETVSEEAIPALGHNDTEIVLQDANCTEEGSKELTCKTCNDVRVVAIPAKGHIYEDGVCSVCGAKEPIIEEYTLTFDANKVNRDSFSTSKQVWSQNGITFTNNKASSTTNVADYGAPVRLYANSEIIVECLNMSKIVFDCNSNDYATALKNSIGASATASSDKVTVEFTELTNKFTVAKLTAQIRLDSITVTVVTEKECEHTNQTTVEVAANCTENGSITVTCDDCDTLLSSENIPALGHKETENITLEATCTEAGNKDLTCDVCGETRTEVIPATGHTCVDGVCTECEEKQPLESTITFDNKVKRIEFSGEKQVWVEGWIKVTNNKAESTTNVADYANPIRFYKSSEIIVECNGIIKLVFNCNANSYATALQSSIGDAATVDGKVVTVVLEETVNSFTITLSAAVWIDSINAYKEESAEIDSASVTLGEDVALNYYVTMADSLENVFMKFTMDGEVYDKELTLQTDGRYKVSLELPPQYMANEILVELIYNDTVVETMIYSVKEYAQSMLNNSESSNELKILLSDMLYYGAAAQTYKGYNLDNLATDGVENLLDASTLVPETTDFTLVSNDEITEYPAYFKGAGVHFADVNKIYVKLSTTEDVTLTINGVEVEVNDTTVYTDGILATQFAETYTFVLYHDGVEMQTLTYSVNAYAYAKQGESAMGKLALALYHYGESAKVYNA